MKKKQVVLIFRGQAIIDEVIPRLEQYNNYEIVLVLENKLFKTITSQILKNRIEDIKYLTADEYYIKYKNMNPEFTLMNPPYEGKSELHLQFLNKAIENTNTHIECIHPSAWILTKTHNKRMRQHEILAVKNIHKYYTKFKFVNGNELFPNANFFYPLVITTIDKTQPNPGCFEIEDQMNNRTLKFTNFDDINLHSDSKVYLNLRKKIILYIKNNPNLFTVGNNKKQYNVPISKLRGSQCSINFFKDDFYTLIPRKCTPVTETKSDFIYGFNTLEEADNFINYLKTDFVRFCLSLYKITGNIKSGSIHKAIPYLDFTESWDNQKLFSKFNITIEEQNKIKNIIPPFYED
tara:strand:- start:476 stop:1522 length:1047 start_codon:yes stop_codon:yes gene_type:complete